MKKILFIGSEVMPYAATGGLGDVLGSLPAAIKATQNDADVRVIMPLYSNISSYWKEKMEDVVTTTVKLSWREQYCGVKKIEKDGVIFYFIDNLYYFDREKMYGEFDDAERFAFFCRAALDILPLIDFFPDVIHANDWHTAPAVIYLKTAYSSDERYRNIKSVFTIHNIEYQGVYDMYILGNVFGLDNAYIPALEYGGALNLMKGAIVYADKVSTVSPRYAQEIMSPEYSHGLHHILGENSYKLCGILNGIDYTYYNPSKDKDIKVNFSYRSIDKKSQNKLALQREYGLPERADVPMIAVVSRLATHKGVDLIVEKIYDLVRNFDIQFVVLGKGEDYYERFFCELQERFPDKVRALICYDRALSKRIYAATDIFLMPSASEPCGLSQMIASRYGAIPVVRETGGLFDSIKHFVVNSGKLFGNGYTFSRYDGGDMYCAVEKAIQCYYSDDSSKYISKIMRTDFSWKGSAQKYLDMYETIM